MPKILIIEDDPQITKILKLNLKLGGYETESASSVQDAWNKINEDQYDLLLLDVGLPDGSGFDLCERTRENGLDTPIIFLSARTDESSVVKGIQKGADDYIRKPFGLEELKARIDKFLKRLPGTQNLVKFGELVIDPVNRTVHIMGEMLILGRKELDILTLLARKAGDIVTRENILSTLYENSELYDRTVDSHMSHLRKKIREMVGRSLQISSVYGIGYRLEWKTR